MTRRALVARVMAALLGGYAFAAATTACLSAVLVPAVGRVDAVWLGTIPGPFIFAGGMMAAFATRSALRAWAWLLGLAGILLAIRFLLLA